MNFPLIHIFNKNSNLLDYLAGIPQGVSYDVDRPQYLNYAGIGAHLGHVVTCAFDNIGRKFGKNGIYKDWWTPGMNKKFLQRAACISRQYENYNVRLPRTCFIIIDHR